MRRWIGLVVLLAACGEGSAPYEIVDPVAAPVAPVAPPRPPGPPCWFGGATSISCTPGHRTQVLPNCRVMCVPEPPLTCTYDYDCPPVGCAADPCPDFACAGGFCQLGP